MYVRGVRNRRREAAEGLALHRILIVEDNDFNRDVLSRHLRRRGYEVVIAADGVDGLAAAQSDRPDLILMDLGLPRMDGWECTRQLKMNAATRDIPVIALSAHAMVGDRERALNVGCDDFDSKPIDLDRLSRKMERMFTRCGQTCSAIAAEPRTA